MIRGADGKTTFRALIDENAAARPDKSFLAIDETSVTFGQLRGRVTSAANGLLALGVGPGDTVAMLTLNCVEWVDVWLAATQIGAISTPVNAAFRGDFLVHQLRDSGAKLILVDHALLPLLVDVAGDLPDLRVVLVRGGTEAIPDVPSALGAMSVHGASVLAEQPSDVVAGGRPLGWNEPACLFYTSGTTGPSKGVILTQQSLALSASSIAAAYAYDASDVLYGAVPLFHLSGSLGLVMPALLTGLSSVLDSGFHVSSCWDRVRAVGATVFVGVGPMVVMLFGLPPDPSDAALPLRLVVAAPIPAELHRAIEERYAVEIGTALGMTEAFPLALSSVGVPTVPGTSGRPNPNFEVVVVDDDDIPVPTGTVGEIVCRPLVPHAMFEGYRNRPEATLEQFRNLWFHTGDLGRFDGEGNLAFSDRKKDAIRRRGENISSFEVEQSILRHPSVAECAAHAVPSPLGEDDVKVCVVLVPGQELPAEDLYAYCAEHLPRFAVPRYIETMDALPKNAVGRVQKMVLRDRPIGAETWDRDAVSEVAGR